jgi:L-cysteate sulfo-lyase
MTLEDAPRVRFAHLPTPLEPMPRLRAALGAAPRLFVKRDDCTGLAFGGNKTRKLEFTLGLALAQGCDVLITTGGTQSNHVRQTVAAAARCGLACHAVIANPLASPPGGYLTSGNLLLDQVMGAVIHEVIDDDALVQAKVRELEAGLRAEGRKPFIVPLGASDEVGSQGYVLCARELLQQCEDAAIDLSHVVLSTGSSGTHAGLLTGLRLAGSTVEVVGISSSEPALVKIDKVKGIARRLLVKLGEPEWDGFEDDVEVHDDYVGVGYGAETAAANAAIRLVARTEGLLLDPVYTGKVMAGLIDQLARGRFDGARDVVFLHTGGAPALFAYGEGVFG